MSAIAVRERDVLPLAFAVTVACHEGVLGALDAGPRRASELARELELDPRALGLLVDVLAAFDIVAAEGDTLCLGPVLTAVRRSMPRGLDGEQRFWSTLPRFLSAAQRVFSREEEAAGRPGLYAGIVPALAVMWQDAAIRLADGLAGHGPRVLDVGCGAGTWSLELAARRTDVRVTGVDFAPVLEAFEARARSLGLGSRVNALAGNAHEVSPPAGAFDVAILGNLLRLEPPPRAASLVTRAAACLAPGGQLVVVDALAHGGPRVERDRAVYALHLGMRSPDGAVHAPALVRQWLVDAGLRDPGWLDLGEGPGALAAIRAWSRR